MQQAEAGADEPGARHWGERLLRFAEDECRGSSPLYEELARSASRDSALLRWLASVAGPRANANLLFAAVHDRLLAGDGNADLRRHYATLVHSPTPPEGAFGPFRAFCVDHADSLATLLATRVTQTNEPARGSYLLPALVAVGRAVGQPLFLVDVGTAAGINLLLDRFHYDYGDGRTAGDPDARVRVRTDLRAGVPALGPIPGFAGRVGIDVAPVSANDPEATRWLEACIWPEHADRLANLRHALNLVRSLPPQILEGNAVDLVRPVAESAPADSHVVVVNTNVLPYFHGDEIQRYAAALSEISTRRPVTWICAENSALLRASGFGDVVDGAPTTGGGVPLVMASLTARRRTNTLLAITGAHGRWLAWHGP